MIKRLASCVREFKRDSILAPLCVTMEVVMEVVIPLLMARLIDNGINAGNMPYLIKMGIFLALSAGISMLFGALSGRFAARASAGFARNLRHDLYGKVQTFSFANIDKFSSAGIVTRLTTDVTNLQNAYQMIIRVAVRAPGNAAVLTGHGIFHQRAVVAGISVRDPCARARPVLIGAQSTSDF